MSCPSYCHGQHDMMTSNCCSLTSAFSSEWPQTKTPSLNLLKDGQELWYVYYNWQFFLFFLSVVLLWIQKMNTLIGIHALLSPTAKHISCLSMWQWNISYFWISVYIMHTYSLSHYCLSDLFLHLSLYLICLFLVCQSSLFVLLAASLTFYLSDILYWCICVSASATV